MSTTQLAITYRQTKAGEWVVCGPADVVKAGETVMVTKRNGSTKQERIISVGKPFPVARGYAVYGYLGKREGQAPGSGRSVRTVSRLCTCGLHRYFRPCKTDGNCSSFGDSRSCGGCECDGF